MTNAKKQQDIYEHGGSDGDVFDDFSTTDDADGAETSGVESTDDSRTEEIGFAERLSDILVDVSDGDLTIQRNDGGVRVLQWLQALDTQVIGACRVDERLKPLLKLSVSNDAAEERLVAHLSQHFEPSETGMLARCLCIPLVSIRVGKNIKQRKRLIPTDKRGSLNLVLLPTSELRLSFIGDDGSTERLCTFSCSLQCSAVVIEEISADTSCRSFLVNIPDHKVFYFWCSEKSLLLGKELLAKMKDLLMRKPSLAELTGIGELRLECFAAHLRAYFVGSAVSKTQTSSACPSTLFSAASTEASQNASFLYPCSKPTMRYRQTSSHSVKTSSLHQGSLSPRSSSFKEGLPKALVSLRSAVRDKSRRRSDNLITLDDLPIRSSIGTDTSMEICKTQVIPPLRFLESLGKSVAMTPLSSVALVTPLGSSLLSPYYCFCPLRASNLQYTVPSSQLPKESLYLPPLTSFLPATTRTRFSSTLLTTASTASPLNISNVTSLGLPNFLPDPFLRLPPFSTSGSHQMMQIPTFTSLMCDPIIHTPVIDVCSSGQGYLVSAGPAISTSIPSLQSQFTNPLSRSIDSAAENGARETLRMLINGTSQTNSQFMNVIFPAVLTSSQENQSLLLAGGLAGRQGLYSSSSDVDAIASSIAALGLVSLSAMSVKDSFGRCGSNKEDFDSQSKPNGVYDLCSDLSPDASHSSDKSE